MLFNFVLQYEVIQHKGHGGGCYGAKEHTIRRLHIANCL